MIQPAFSLKNQEFNSNLLIAPLAGVTDISFRKVLRLFEPGFMFSEMIHINALAKGNVPLSNYIDLEQEYQDTGIQLIGNEPEVFAKVALNLNQTKLRWLDLNMGCSVPQVLKQRNGAWLLREPGLSREILSALRENFDGILTVKIRSGYDLMHPVFLDYAQMAFDVGLDGVILHPRYAKQKFSGSADWNQINLLKEKFPDRCIIGNGDVTNISKYHELCTDSKVDALMLARGAMKAPWLIEQIYHDAFRKKYSKITKEFVLQCLKKHWKWSVEQKGPRKGTVEMRKYIGWYFSGFPGAKALRMVLNQIECLEDIALVEKVLYDNVDK